MIGFLLRNAHLFALAVLLGAAASVALLKSKGVRKDYTLEAFVADDSEDYTRFRSLMEEFTSNELALIAVQGPSPESDEWKSTLNVVADLQTRVRTLDAVERATSIADVPSVVRTLLGDQLRNHPLFVDNLVSRDGKTAAILLQMRGEGATGAVRKDTVAKLKQFVREAQAAHPEKHIIIAGPYVTLIDMYDYVDHDLRVFSFAAFALLILTLSAVFRRPAPVVFALLISTAATLCTLGLAVVLNLPMTLITQMIVILVMVLSVANCVHLGVAADDIFVAAPFYHWHERARRIWRRMTAPCAAVMLTTAVGFGSVSISGITPVRVFGLLMVTGLSLALLFSLITIPLLPRVRPPSDKADPDVLLPNALIKITEWVIDRPGKVIAAFAIAVALFAAAFPSLHFESDFVKNFRPESDVRKAYEFIESTLTPTGSAEMIVRRKDGASVLNPDAVAALRTAADRAVNEFEPVRKALTLADLLTLGPGGSPTSSFDLNTRLSLIKTLLGPDAVRNFLNDDATALRMNLRVVEGYPVQQKLDMGEKIRQMTADALGPEYTVEATGLYLFYATLVADLWRDQFRSLAITIPAVFIVLVIVLRSFRMAAVAIVPTVLPVVFCLGAMSILGIPVNMTTAMMLSVTVGIAVDDALHYLFRFEAIYKDRRDDRYALKAAGGGVGRACVFTTIVIAGGFWILTLSQFLPTAYFGGLLAFTMGAALATDLLLLPAMVYLFKPLRRLDAC